MLSGESKVIHTRRWQYLDGLNQEIVVSVDCNVSLGNKLLITLENNTILDCLLKHVCRKITVL